MKKRWTISQARARLSDLVAEVLRTDAAFSIEHRDREERVLLVSEKRYRYLEDTLDRLSGDVDQPFPLAGSMELCGTEVELERDLVRIREEQAALAMEKLAAET